MSKSFFAVKDFLKILPSVLNERTDFHDIKGFGVDLRPFVKSRDERSFTTALITRLCANTSAVWKYLKRAKSRVRNTKHYSTKHNTKNGISKLNNCCNTKCVHDENFIKRRVYGFVKQQLRVSYIQVL